MTQAAAQPTHRGTERPPSADAAGVALARATPLIAVQRWDEAVAVLEPVQHEPRVAVLLNIARNLRAMRDAWPDLYEKLFAVLCRGDHGPYQPFVSEKGDVGVAAITGPAKLTPLCGAAEPMDVVRKLVADSSVALSEDRVIAQLGIGDGQLLRHLAGNAPKLISSGMQQQVVVVEPDVRLVLMVLRLFDLSGEAGPIRQERFRWFVGDDWHQQLKRELESSYFNPPPQMVFGQGLDREKLAATFRDLARRRMDQVQSAHERIEAYYASRTTAEYAQLFGSNPPRPPRALLMTSRFTTVLQHSTAEMASALERLGWQTQTQIEPSDWQRAWNGGLILQIDDFRPDLVVAIDHLRYERKTCLPATLPHLSWTQDHLANLTCEQAGQSITRRDFILSAVRPMYTGLWGYPARQFIDMPKLTATPLRPTSWKQDGADVVYVSTASAEPATLVNHTLSMAESMPNLRRVLESSCERMLQLYEQGDSLPTMWHIAQLVDEMARQQQVCWTSPHIRAMVVNRLTHPLNNALYRQQALRWVIQVCSELGLTLALYGRGWSEHPEFARYDQGWVNYGSDLETLTRRSRINLQIIPSLCLHQRMLDGLVAGGFFLVRSNPADELMPALAAFLQANAPDAGNVAEAMEQVAGDNRVQLQQMLERCACLSELGASVDTVEWVQCCRRARLFDADGQLLPRLDEVSFGGPEALKERLQRFSADRELRDTIAREQREAIEQRLTYLAGMRRAVRRMHELLLEDAQGERVQA